MCSLDRPLVGFFGMRGLSGAAWRWEATPPSGSAVAPPPDEGEVDSPGRKGVHLVLGKAARWTTLAVRVSTYSALFALVGPSDILWAWRPRPGTGGVVELAGGGRLPRRRSAAWRTPPNECFVYAVGFGFIGIVGPACSLISPNSLGVTR